MAQYGEQIEVYLEVAQKRTFAVALDWPGWCRSGRDEADALEALWAYGSRYARLLESTGLGFQAPADAADLRVVDRLAGNATTNFGAPALALARDAQPVEPEELERWQVLLQAIWRALDAAMLAARGKVLSTGPRGGGRALDKIVAHVCEGDLGYLGALGSKPELREAQDVEQALAQIRQAILSGLGAAVRGELPTIGPRGGARWTARYFVRRLAWHELDHVWEIEDRAGI
jgi:hypothetical protein